jgi:hypothetical protein
MIVAIHQPHFFPWLGYLHRIMDADLFVFLDHVQYEHQNFQNRVRIKNGTGSQWITVPLLHSGHSQPIASKLICNRNNGNENGRRGWGKSVFATLEAVYSRAPYFNDYAPALRGLMNAEHEKLAELNRKSLDFLLDAFDIRTPVIHSSDLDARGQKTELAINLCRAVDAKVLLCGMGGSRGYMDVAALERAGVRVAWQDFRHPRYPQHPHPENFVPGLSALDLLFNCGPASGDVLRGKTPAPPRAVSVPAPDELAEPVVGASVLEKPAAGYGESADV